MPRYAVYGEVTQSVMIEVEAASPEEALKEAKALEVSTDWTYQDEIDDLRIHTVVDDDRGLSYAVQNNRKVMKRWPSTGSTE